MAIVENELIYPQIARTARLNSKFATD